MTTSKTTEVLSAAILTSNATEVELIPGEAGFIIQPKSVMTIHKDGSTKYATNVAAKIAFDGGDDIAAIALDALPTAGAEIDVILGHTAPAGTGVVFKTDTGNPASGDIDVFFKIEYELVRDN